MMWQTYIQAFQRYLLEAGPLAPYQWEAIASCCAPVYVARRNSLMGFPGDLFFVATGLLKEVQEGMLVDRFKTSITCFHRQADVFFVSLDGQHNVLVALADTALVRINRLDVVQLRHGHLPLIELFESLYTRWYERRVYRNQLLQLPKNVRYAAFQEQFPGLAAHLLDKEVMQYLDISEGYFPKVK